MENQVKGDKKAVAYLMEKMEVLGANALKDFDTKPVYTFRSSKNERYDMLLKAIRKTYPNKEIREFTVGPIIGSHLGSGCTGIGFEGADRLDIG